MTSMLRYLIKALLSPGQKLVKSILDKSDDPPYSLVESNPRPKLPTLSAFAENDNERFVDRKCD